MSDDQNSAGRPRQPFIVRRKSSRRPQTDRDYLKSRLRQETASWVKDTAAGMLTAIAVFLLALLLVNLGVANAGQKLSFGIFKPKEFWDSFSGLVMVWSEWNEWLLIALGMLALGLTILVFLLWRRRPAGSHAEEAQPRLARLERQLRSLRTVGALAMVAALFFAAYARQWYLWHVALPVRPDQIGVAFTRQIGSTFDPQAVADELWKQGDRDRLVLRQLPVTFSATDVTSAAKYAQRIGAAAVVIYHESGRGSTGPTASAADGAKADKQHERKYSVYIVFADPSLGIDVPVPGRTNTTSTPNVEYRSKPGVEVPYLEATSLSRMMEAVAGILLYDRGSYQAAVDHLASASNAPGGTSESNALIQFYLGASNYLLQNDDQATKAFQHAIDVSEQEPQLSPTDQLLLPDAYTYLAQLLFSSGRVQDSNDLLGKANELLTRVSGDSSKDLPFLRRLLTSRGSVYIGLMNNAIYEQNAAARRLWADKAKATAEALERQSGDARAQAVAIWLLYRAGECGRAYAAANALLSSTKDQDVATAAHRRLLRIADLRDNTFTSPEAKLHLDAILKADPNSLPELQNLRLYYGFQVMQQDTGYLQHERQTVGHIVALDPSRTDTLQDYISDVYTFAGLYLQRAAVNYDVGDARTLLHQQDRWGRDPGYLEQVVNRINSTEPEVILWKQTTPDSPEPLLEGARLYRAAEQLLQQYLVSQLASPSRGKVDQELQQSYARTWTKTREYTRQALDVRYRQYPRNQAQAHRLLSVLLSDQAVVTYYSSPANMEAAGQQIAEAVSEAQAAAALIEAHPADNPSELYDDVLVYAQLYGTSREAAIIDPVRAAEYSRIAETAEERHKAIQSQSIKAAGTHRTYLEGITCPGTNLREEGKKALEEGRFQDAVRLLQQYRTQYPGDPVPITALAWAQYKSGDPEAGLQTLAQAPPQDATAAQERVVILLALGRESEARSAAATTFTRLQGYSMGDDPGLVERIAGLGQPAGVQIDWLSALGADVRDLAREHPQSRPAVRDLLRDLARDVAKLDGDDPHREYASRLILAFDAIGEANIWAGDYNAAQSMLGSAITINPDHVPAQSDLGLLALAQGNPANAHAAYGLGLKAAASYKDLDEGMQEGQLERDAASALRAVLGAGPDQESGALTAATQLESASQALRQFLKQRPDLQPPGNQLVAQLESAVASYRMKAGVTLTGVVIDSQTREPLPGASVVILQEGVSWQAFKGDKQQIKAVVSSGEAGTFLIDAHLQRGSSYSLGALLEGHITMKTTITIPKDSPPTFELGPLALQPSQ